MNITNMANLPGLQEARIEAERKRQAASQLAQSTSPPQTYYDSANMANLPGLQEAIIEAERERQAASQLAQSERTGGVDLSSQDISGITAPQYYATPGVPGNVDLGQNTTDSANMANLHGLHGPIINAAINAGLQALEGQPVTQSAPPVQQPVTQSAPPVQQTEAQSTDPQLTYDSANMANLPGLQEAIIEAERERQAASQLAQSTSPPQYYATPGVPGNVDLGQNTTAKNYSWGMMNSLLSRLHNPNLIGKPNLFTQGSYASPSGIMPRATQAVPNYPIRTPNYQGYSGVQFPQWNTGPTEAETQETQKKQQQAEADRLEALKKINYQISSMGGG